MLGIIKLCYFINWKMNFTKYEQKAENKGVLAIFINKLSSQSIEL